MAKIIIDPVNRMEGHLGVEINTAAKLGSENGGLRVGSAYLKGNLYRGIENILSRRPPRDAMVICQRI